MGGGSRGGGGTNDGGNSGGSSADSDANGGGHDRSGGMGAALARLTIAQKDDGQVTVTDDQGRARTLKTDGSKVHDDAAPGGPAQVQATWDKDDGSLLVDVKPDKGSARTESYVVSNDRKHLYLTVTVSRRFQGSTKIVRAYDLAPEPAPAASPAPTPPPS